MDCAGLEERYFIYQISGRRERISFFPHPNAIKKAATPPERSAALAMKKNAERKTLKAEREPLYIEPDYPQQPLSASINLR